MVAIKTATGMTIRLGDGKAAVGDGKLTDARGIVHFFDAAGNHVGSQNSQSASEVSS